MSWRCINDIKEPTGASETRIEEREVVIAGEKQIVKIQIGGATCTKEPKSCKQYRTFTQVCEPNSNQEEVPVAKTTFVADKKAKKGQRRAERTVVLR